MLHHIAIFASGTGSNAKKIVEHFKHNRSVTVSLIVTNKADAPVLAMARENGIPTMVIDRDHFYKTEDILEKFNKFSIGFVVLAGFLWLVPTYLVRAFEKRMVNIHPALLPKYGGKGMYGMRVHEAVKKAGDTETGITIHFVNEQYDDGDIIFQAKCPVNPEDSPEDIAKKIHQMEHRHFPKVIEKLLAESFCKAVTSGSLDL
ncbi:MAG: phosphoribosylglycinamide formyltransferase [Saprospiraceae bacterium]|nr:phosphoribosylglycinamide formyltransferase [Saprospiraceae bacterium]MCF8252672.1 phosphoribosylglycinamide formyltransferase [Saprospiraceae bacterium]MCF8282871.1 phosphoribosylglycinamide formyltransferase [Bacteroidales bacterium]MCF8314244.1 phosphoribosylglycinamide formyltransferase [Saprospiraceae bacterium]MCF8443060.1 phosphoribosylglycinamide formyltransferase [Saprospiraceae bacterium]